VGPRAGLDTEARGRILSSLPGIEPRSPGRPVRSQTLSSVKTVPNYIRGTLQQLRHFLFKKFSTVSVTYNHDCLMTIVIQSD
jgi:hypothetical protein